MSARGDAQRGPVLQAGRWRGDADGGAGLDGDQTQLVAVSGRPGLFVIGALGIEPGAESGEAALAGMGAGEIALDRLDPGIGILRQVVAVAIPPHPGPGSRLHEGEVDPGNGNHGDQGQTLTEE